MVFPLLLVYAGNLGSEHPNHTDEYREKSSCFAPPYHNFRHSSMGRRYEVRHQKQSISSAYCPYYVYQKVLIVTTYH